MIIYIERENPIVYGDIPEPKYGYSEEGYKSLTWQVECLQSYIEEKTGILFEAFGYDDELEETPHLFYEGIEITPESVVLDYRSKGAEDFKYIVEKDLGATSATIKALSALSVFKGAV